MAKQAKTEQARVTFDVFGHGIPQPFQLPPRRNPFRVGETVVMFDGRKWTRVGINTPEAVVWKRILSGSLYVWQSWYNLLMRDLAAAKCATGEPLTIGKMLRFEIPEKGQKAA